MPVTIQTTSNTPNAWDKKLVASADGLLEASCPEESKRCKQMLQSSFGDIASANISPSNNGFVRAAHAAYSKHHHLTVRPEDVWFSILTQLSFYVNAHAEELRSVFVSHEGQKEVEVREVGTIQTVDVGRLAVRMTEAMAEHIKDADLRQWIMPDFTTTEETDKATAAVLMMGTMQKYFTYKMALMCGIPSVTLLGDREDWVKMRSRLDRIGQWGKEPEQFAARLKTVLDHLILSFDAPSDPKVLEFWSKIAHYKGGGSGPTFLSGWITAFCCWRPTGELVSSTGFGASGAICEIGDTTFQPVDSLDIPAGYASVPVTVDDNGTKYATRMVAGSVGIAPKGPDSIRPVAGWWMYEVSDSE